MIEKINRSFSLGNAIGLYYNDLLISGKWTVHFLYMAHRVNVDSHVWGCWWDFDVDYHVWRFLIVFLPPIKIVNKFTPTTKPPVPLAAAAVAPSGFWSHRRGLSGRSDPGHSHHRHHHHHHHHHRRIVNSEMFQNFLWVFLIPDFIDDSSDFPFPYHESQ